MDRQALAHHFNRAMDHASVLIALAQHRLAHGDPLNEVRPRQQAQLDDYLHLFSFHARKAIELAELTESAKRVAVARPDDVPPPEVTARGVRAHTTRDLWWVLNRIIHSQFLSIEESEDSATASSWSADPYAESYWTPSVFVVRSDHDSDTTLHWVEVHHLVRAFLSLCPEFRDAGATAV